MFRLYGVFLEVGGFFCSHGIQFWWTIHIFLHGATNPWLHHTHFMPHWFPNHYSTIFKRYMVDVSKDGVHPAGSSCFVAKVESKIEAKSCNFLILRQTHCHMIDCWWHFRSNAIKFLLDIRKITMKNPIDILFDGYPIGNRWHITI